MSGKYDHISTYSHRVASSIDTTVNISMSVDNK